MSRLGDDEIAAALENSEWTRDGDAITREYTFDGFTAAMAFARD